MKPTIAELRAFFARDCADTLVEHFNSTLTRRAPTRGWTTRAVWYENDEKLVGVVGEQERSYTDLALAHGLHLANGRHLTLVLPVDWAHPTRHRIPWLTANVTVYTHTVEHTNTDGTLTPTGLEQPPQLKRMRSKEETRKQAGGPEKTPALHLGVNSEWVRDLVEWATEDPRLDAAHTGSLRSWSCQGQRVLTIGGKRQYKITAGIDAQHAPALAIKATHSLTADQIDQIKTAVETGIQHAVAKVHGGFEEHHLQVLLRREPTRLRLEHPLLREAPAWRPVGGGKLLGRGFVDLVGLDPVGDITIVETKLGTDDMLVLQGLDYWIWATAPENHQWLTTRLHAAPDARARLLFATGGKGGTKPRLGRYERTLLQLLDPEIEWRIALIEGWNDQATMTVTISAPRALP